MRAGTAPRRLGFDASVYVDPETARKLRDCGHRIAIRYIRRDKHVNEKPDTTWPISLSSQELRELLAADLDISIVQFYSGRAPSKELGEKVGAAAAHNCKALSIPAEVTVWCDLEWPSKAPPAADVLVYANAWAKEVVDAGYEAGMYVGANCGVNGDQLWSMPKVRHYWKSASLVPWVSNRGFQMVQTLEIEVQGIKVDQDIAMFDALGDRFKIVTT
jgi:Rv2525c-like, glycoside hydrolase-like domain